MKRVFTALALVFLLVTAAVADSAGHIQLNKPHTEPMIPKWGLGYMQSQWGYNEGGEPFGYDTQDGILNHARALRGLPNPYGDHRHPADIMVLDMYWCGGQVGDFSCWDWPNNMIWDKQKFPDPAAMVRELHDMDFKLMMNYHAGGIDTHRDDWMSAMRSHLDMGLDAPWLDFWTAGSAVETEIWKMLREHKGNDRRLMWMARHYTLPNTENAEGGQFDDDGIYQDGIGVQTPPDEDEVEKTMPVHWTGDVAGSWLGLQQSIEGIVYGPDGAMGGWSYLHSDTPGHSGVSGPEDGELAIRWIQFSDFTTGTRNHGWTPRDVWAWGPLIEEYSYFSRMLRYRLIPYTYTYLNRIWEQAIPLTLPIKYAYPGEADELKYQYLFGDHLLVAPVYRAAAEFPEEKMDVYLPKGEQWVDYWSHEIFEGGQTIRADVGEQQLKYIPLYVRMGAIIPVGPEIFHIDPSVHPDPLTLDIYPAVSGQSEFVFYDDDGESLGYQRGEFARTKFTVERSPEKIRIVLGESVGEYSGRPSSRNYILKVNLIDSEFRSVKMDGKELVFIEDPVELQSDAGRPGSWAMDQSNNILYVRVSTSTDLARTLEISQ